MRPSYLCTGNSFTGKTAYDSQIGILIGPGNLF